MCKLPAVCVAFAVQVATVLCLTRARPKVSQENHCCWQHRRRISPVNTRVTRIGGGELCVAKLSDGRGVPMEKLVSGGHRESEQIERTHGTVSYRERFTFPTKANALFCL
jgi:hypothetical protein